MKQTFATLLIFAASSWGLADDKADHSPTHANVAYGTHKPNVLDIWIAEGEGPRPLHVYIHGGGWKSRRVDGNYSIVFYFHTLTAHHVGASSFLV